jgi:hypothetical protein
MTGVLEAMRDALGSTEYRCPGEHRLDGVRGDRYEYLDEMMDEMGLPVDWDADRLAVEHPEQYRALRARQEANWVSRGACTQAITIDLEYDGDEYATYSYPVASGPCAAALGMDEDFEYERPLWQAAFERWRLQRIFLDALRSAPALEPVS